MEIEGILGKKIGMTQLFDEKGEVHGVTVVEAGPVHVVQVKSAANDGYDAVQVGFGAVKRVNKPMKGHLKGLGDFRHLREMRVEDPSQWKHGSEGRRGAVPRRRPRRRHRRVQGTRFCRRHASLGLPRRPADARPVGQGRVPRVPSGPATRPDTWSRGCTWPATWATPTSR